MKEKGGGVCVQFRDCELKGAGAFWQLRVWLGGGRK